jgi:hypothetical protein
LLALLVRRAGDVVTSAEIRDVLWPEGREYGDFDHALGIAVKKLRDALGDDADKPSYIETLRRRGYRFVAPVTYDYPETKAADELSRAEHFVGRDAQLARFEQAMALVAKNERQVLFVTSETGIGKTALVDEFLRQAAEHMPEALRARGQCVEGYGGQEPYFSMLEALGQLCRAAGGAAVVNVLTEIAPMWLLQFASLVKGPQRERLMREAATGTRVRMLREIEEALDAIAAASPVVIVLEDVHWADPSTLDLIATLARHRAPAALLLICTYRPFEVALADHPLMALKQELVIHGAAAEIAVGPLSASEVGEYLRSAWPAVELPERLTDTIYRHSAGNPLFVRAAIEHLIQEGVIAHDGGRWEIHRAIDESTLSIPESVRELIEMRIGLLPPELHDVLEIASVVGVAFAAELCVVDGEPAAAVEARLETLARRFHVLRGTTPKTYPDGGVSTAYEFSHALYREVFYQSLMPARRTLLHALVGARLEELYGSESGDVAMELARHFEHAFRWDRAVHYLRLAATRATRRLAHRDAAELLERAVELSKRLSPAEGFTVRIAVLEKLAEIYTALLDPRAVATYEQLYRQAQDKGLLDLQVRTLMRMAFPLALENLARGLDAAKRALELSAKLEDPVLRASTRARAYAFGLWLDRWNTRDAAQFHQTLDEIGTFGNPQLHALHLMDRSIVDFHSSQYRSAYRAVTDGMTTLDFTEPDLYLNIATWTGRMYQLWSLIFLGEWNDALREIDATTAASKRNGSRQREHGCVVLRALVHLFAFDYAGALALCEISYDSPLAATVRMAGIVAGAACAGLGDRERAEKELLAVRDQLDRHPGMRDAYWRVMLEWALTEFRAGSDDLAEARAQAQRFLETTASRADRTWQALAWELSARIALRENDLARARADVSAGIASIADCEAPLAAWKIYATGAVVHAEDARLSASYRETSASTVRWLADSLSPHETLQQTFLAAAPVRAVSGDD